MAAVRGHCSGRDPKVGHMLFSVLQLLLEALGVLLVVHTQLQLLSCSAQLRSAPAAGGSALSAQTLFERESRAPA